MRIVFLSRRFGVGKGWEARRVSSVLIVEGQGRIPVAHETARKGRAGTFVVVPKDYPKEVHLEASIDRLRVKGQFLTVFPGATPEEAWQEWEKSRGLR